MRRKPHPVLSKMRNRDGKEPELPVAPHGYVDSTIIMTRLGIPPFLDQQTMPGDAQIFRIAVQAFGKRMAERLMVELRIGGATVNKFPAYHLLAHGYSTTQVDPYMVKAGEIVSVETSLLENPSWWRRIRDRFWDWWVPPKARVIVSGVIRMPEVEA